MRAGVNTEVEMREYEAVAGSVILDAIDAELGVARPVHHAVVNGDGKINPRGRHSVPMVRHEKGLNRLLEPAHFADGPIRRTQLYRR